MSTHNKTTIGQIRAFDFQEHAVRTLVMAETPWFVAADVCRVLEIANARDAVKALDVDERASVGIADTSSSTRKSITTNVINESGLYALIFKSRKPEAKKFRKWVTAEVLPALRKQGAYSVGEQVGGELAGDGLLSVLDYVRVKLAALPVGALMWADVLALGRAVQGAEKDLGVNGAVRAQADGSRVRTFSPLLLETVWTVQVEPQLQRRRLMPAVTDLASEAA
jgi:prophage antirepressor-like protein